MGVRRGVCLAAARAAMGGPRAPHRPLRARRVCACARGWQRRLKHGRGFGAIGGCGRQWWVVGWR